MNLAHTLLELGHATSQNLKFAHQKDVHISYGEETITETNLLEIRRRHPEKINLRTFSKFAEARNGADWEFQLIGEFYRLTLRVQAKRMTKKKKINFWHRIGGVKEYQHKVLIDSSRTSKAIPVYCLYLASIQKTSCCCHFKAGQFFETGCLLVSAEHINAKSQPTFENVKKDCFPWHLLADCPMCSAAGQECAHFSEFYKTLFGEEFATRHGKKSIKNLLNSQVFDIKEQNGFSEVPNSLDGRPFDEFVELIGYHESYAKQPQDKVELAIPAAVMQVDLRG